MRPPPPLLLMLLAAVPLVPINGVMGVMGVAGDDWKADAAGPVVFIVEDMDGGVFGWTGVVDVVDVVDAVVGPAARKDANNDFATPAAPPAAAAVVAGDVAEPNEVANGRAVVGAD